MTFSVRDNICLVRFVADEPFDQDEPRERDETDALSDDEGEAMSMWDPVLGWIDV